MKIKGIYNRFVFMWYKRRFKTCGKHVLFESEFELEGPKYISLGNNIRTKPRLHIAAIEKHNGIRFNPEIIIDSGVSINYDVHIASIEKVWIGEGSLLGSRILITDHLHGDTSYSSLLIPPSKRKLVSKGPVEIGKNVWIGDGVSIMPGVSIGDNSVIGANSVVTSDIPSFSVAVGCPAKVIKVLGE